jgi:hypothetical protein
VRDTIQRVAAGVITPALSMLFVLIGDALYQYDPQAFTLEWVSVLPAAILGAPFAVPAALLIRLRHLWRCVPLIALCAAVGIEVQRNISTALGDSSSPAQTLGPTLMFVWVFPAAFGVAAALLLKWKESLYLAALPLAAVLAPFLAIQGGVLARERAPALSAAHSWSVLHVGMHVYTGGDPSSNGQKVCASLGAILAAEREQPAQCFNVARGVPAVVDGVLACARTDPYASYDWAPHVKLHARDGSWRGFTDAAKLQPDVPQGTLLDMERDWGAPLVIEDDRGVQTLIGGSALAQLLRYSPKRDASLYVQVVNGRYRGLRGWTYIQDVDTGGVALGQYDLEYPNTKCVK